MITVTLATTDRTITEYRTDNPLDALRIAADPDNDDYVFVKVEHSFTGPQGVALLKAWANNFGL